MLFELFEVDLQMRNEIELNNRDLLPKETLLAQSEELQQKCRN
jgi:hypothetical protein